MSFHQESVENLRKMLIDSGKYSVESAKNIKGKANLVEAVMTLNENNHEVSQLFDEAEMLVSKVQEIDDDDSPPVPSYNSRAWPEYVMSQFHDDEKVNGFPKIDGLRRVAELLLGDIIDSRPNVMESNLLATDSGRAVCVYVVQFNWFNTGERRVFAASGGASIQNTDELFAIYPECMAETRAEARALRRALKIKIASADEIKNVKQATPAKATTTGEWDSNEKITSAQKSFIEKKCGQLKINVNKFVNSGQKSYNSIDEVSCETAQKMITAINGYQTNLSSIPDTLKEI